MLWRHTSGAEVSFQSFLTSALYRGEWLTSHYKSWSSRGLHSGISCSICASQFQCNVFYTKPCFHFNSSYKKHMVFTINKPETNAKIPGMPEEEACAWRICWCVKFRTKGCTRTSMLAHTVLSPCTKNANENEKWVLKNIRKKHNFILL